LKVLKSIFKDVNFAEKRALDLGTMEFVAPILMSSHGAGEVIAYDRKSLVPQFEQLAKIYDLSRTRYLYGRPLLELRAQMKEEGVDPVFDIVNFTGVLYHCMDPLSSLAIARSFLRENGLMILETSVSTDEGYVARCNHRGTLYSGSNYFQVSVSTLDYWCRILRMEVIDAYWRGGPELKRAFLVLRACPEIVAESEDTWIRSDFLSDDFFPVGLDYSRLKSDLPPVEYCPASLPSKPHLQTETTPSYLDTFRTLRESPDLDQEVRDFRAELVPQISLQVREEFKEAGRVPGSSEFAEEVKLAISARLKEAVENRFGLLSAGSLNLSDV
jgi:hypothetical protein